MESLKKFISKEYLYVICFCMFCIIDQRVLTSHVNSGLRETFCYLTGVVMAVLVLSHYSRAELLKWKKAHLAWSVIGTVCCIGIFVLGLEHCYFVHSWLTLVIAIWCWGFVLVQTMGVTLVERQLPVLNKPFAIIWVCMMLWMCFSRSEHLWPVAYLIMFGCFYLTSYTKAELEQMVQGGATGIIWGFFVAQIYAFLYRPFDQERYVGWYTNSNNNVLFYVIVLAAVLLKLYTAMKRDKSKGWKLFYFLGTGVVLSFAFMTIGRIGWITAFALVFIGLLLICGIRKKKSFLINGVIVVLCFCITFPVCFGLARYIPPLRHHPVWFAEEYAETKVHSWDPWNSEKFIDLDEFLESALGRILKSFEDLSNNTDVLGDVQIDSEIVESMEESIMAEYEESVEAPAESVVVESMEAPVASVIVESVEVPQEVAPVIEATPVPEDKQPVNGRIPVLTEEEGLDGYLVRSSIYKHFIGDLNWTGHKKDEIGVQLISFYWVGHAHNIYLQMGTDFGIPAMILFTICILYSFIRAIRKWRESKTETWAVVLLWITVPALFGIFEFCWGAGTLTFAVLFFAWRWMICEQ